MASTSTHPMLDLTPARHCARARAHIAGNEARRLEQQAARLLEQAAAARRRYFRELATVDALGGELDSPFAPLG